MARQIAVTTHSIEIELAPRSMVQNRWIEASDESGSGKRGLVAPVTDDEGNVIAVSIEHWADVIDALANNILAREYMRQRLDEKLRPRFMPNKIVKSHVAKLINRNTESEGA